MIQQWYKVDPANLHRGIDIVRIGVALIILMHPLHGYSHLENIPRFGEFLTSLGYPFGTALAWLVLLVQTASSLALLANRFVVPACIGHIIVICFGQIHVHAQYGWYVVGPGSGGMEWGFILMTCLLGVMWAYWPQKTR
ncbi:DoxX family protein [Undibacterium sp. Di27W]|uniref:DoxX family protein n=1 Tax=Undibacterium sp. Di27W TaxID=3413036 RepID=UPI003BF32947